MKSDTEWRSVKQLGSLIGEAEDIERRIDLASQACDRFRSVWLRRQRVSEKRRIRLYDALVLPVLLFNCGSWGLRKLFVVISKYDVNVSRCLQLDGLSESN